MGPTRCTDIDSRTCKSAAGIVKVPGPAQAAGAGGYVAEERRRQNCGVLGEVRRHEANSLLKGTDAQSGECGGALSPATLQPSPLSSLSCVALIHFLAPVVFSV